jgi:hypothetical protein
VRNLDEVWLEITLARRLQGRAPAKTAPHPVPTRHQRAVAALDYSHYSSLPKHILFFFPSTKHINNSTTTLLNTPHQIFTMATLSCTYNSTPLARAGHTFESYVFVVLCSQPHHLESAMAAPQSSPDPR